MSFSYILGFTKLFCKEITLHKNINDKNLRLIFGEYKKLYIIDASDIPETALDNTYLNLHNIPKTEYSDPLIRFYYYYGDYIVYPYLNYIPIDEMKNEPIKLVLKNNYFIKECVNNYSKSSLYAKIESDENNKYYMVYYINNRIIDNIKNCKKELKINLLTSILNNQKGIDITNKSNNLLNEILEILPVKIPFDKNKNKQSYILKNDISLYDYQIADINWMKQIEKSVFENKNIIEYKYSTLYNVFDDLLLYNGNLIPNNILYPCNMDIIKTLKYYGGNIISEVGLGKTLITLYHILESIKNNNNDNFVEFTNSCNYFYKRGKLKGTNCKSNNIQGELYCKAHKKTIFIDKRNSCFRNLQNFDIKNYFYKENQREYIKTNATLILCPNHLCDQWVQEYYSKFKNNHRVLLIVTYDQYTNVTLADLLFADIVIVSYNFLINKRYIQKETDISSFYSKFKSTGFDINKDLTTDEKENLLNLKSFSKFNLFYWNRIVYDESHEIQNIYNTNLKWHILNICSTYKWNISGTPFANKLSSFINLMSYNTSYLSHNFSSLHTDNLIELGLDSDIIKKCNFLFRRNTKESIKDECQGNILKEQVNLLEFTEQERSIYDGYVQGARSNYYDFLIKLCCHPELNNDTKEMIKNCKTFDEIHKCMVDYNKNLLDKESNRIKNTESDIMYYESEINKFIQPYTNSDVELIEPLRVKLNTSRRQLTISKKTYQEISRTYNYLRVSVGTLKNTSEEITCPICLDDIDESNLTITKCGHKFCWDCIYETHQVQKQTNIAKIKCPTCNTLMNNTELYLLSQQLKNSLGQSDLQKIIENVKSTKIGNIIYFLKTSIQKDDKVILFSQWDELLHKVGGILSEQGLRIMYCSGSVYQRKKAIDSFCKDPNINLILLSSRNAASGINLTIANKIILLEPIYGAKDYRQNIEEQAIGRADRLGQKRPIYIYRFIIKDTVEEDIYKNCIDDTKIRQLH